MWRLFILRLFAGLLLTLLALPLSAQTDSWLPDGLEVISIDNIDQLEPLAYIGRGAMSAWDWWQSYLVIATSSGIYFHDADDNFNTARVIPNPEGSIRSMRWIQDGSLLITDHVMLDYWNYRSAEAFYVTDLTAASPEPRQILSLDVPTEIGVDYGIPVYYNSAYFEVSPDETLLLVSKRDNSEVDTTYLIEIETGQQLAVIERTWGGAKFSSDGTEINFDMWDTIQTWDLEEVIQRGNIVLDKDQSSTDFVTVSEAPEYVYRASSREIRCTDGQEHWIYYGGSLCPESELIFHDMETGTQLAHYRVPYHVSNFFFRPELNLVGLEVCEEIWHGQNYNRCGRISVHFLDVATGEEKGRLPITFDHNFFSIAAPTDSNLLITFGDIVRIWDLREFRQTVWIADYSDFRFSAQYLYCKFPELATDGTLIVPTTTTVQLWDTDTGRLTAILPLGAEVGTVDSSADGRRIAASGTNRMAAVWDIPSTLPTDAPVILDNPFVINREISWEGIVIRASDDGSWVFAGTSPDRRLWDFQADPPHPISLLEWESQRGWFDFSQDGSIILLKNEDQIVRWDADIVREHSALVPEALLSVQPTWAYPYSYSPGPDDMLSTGRGFIMRAVDGTKVNLPFLPWSITGDRYCPSGLSPDHRLLFEAEPGGLHVDTTNFWDVETGRKGEPLTEGLAFAFSPDGRILYATDGDRITLWGVRGD